MPSFSFCELGLLREQSTLAQNDAYNFPPACQDIYGHGADFAFRHDLSGAKSCFDTDLFDNSSDRDDSGSANLDDLDDISRRQESPMELNILGGLYAWGLALRWQQAFEMVFWWVGCFRAASSCTNTYIYLYCNLL